MSQFKDQSFNQRFGTMGDIAEAAYESWADAKDIRWDRFGHNRPRSNMFKWPAFIRYTPDYITHDRLVEVKGCGRDGILKVKQENIEALREWGVWMPVWMYAWNSSTDEHGFFEIDNDFIKWLSDDLTWRRFPDNDKVYWEIPFEEVKSK